MGRSPRRAAKKLIGAARYWAGVSDDAFVPDQHVIDSLIELGAPQDVIAAAKRGVVSDDYEIWPENLDALNVFLDLGSSWDWVALPGGGALRVGIRATEIVATLRIFGFRRARRAKLFRDIRAMERAALDVMNQ